MITTSDDRVDLIWALEKTIQGLDDDPHCVPVETYWQGEAVYRVVVGIFPFQGGRKRIVLMTRKRRQGLRREVIEHDAFWVLYEDLEVA